MLIKDANNRFLINLEHISNLFIDAGNNLVCSVISPNGPNGCENFNLITNNYPAGQFHIRRISALYRQYVVSELGTFIPPKVYEIPSRDESNGISLSNVSVDFINDTGRITADNRVSYGLKVMHRGELLVEGRDYTVTLPLYKGNHQKYKFLIYFLQSRSHYIYTLTINSGFKSVGSDVQVSTSSD